MLHITAADWQRLSPLIDHALDLRPHEQALWLSTDSTVQALAPLQHEHLLALLKQQRSAETQDFLRTLPSLNRRTVNADAFQKGDHIGPYELLCIIGQGGMSQVWHAKRIDGAYQRDVALKLPFAHANAAWREHFIKRLEREVELLAKLEHPNIARFYDAGMTNTALGTQPYLALELVQGVPITQYAATKRLSVHQRCLLLIQVLEAVQFAHQHLVVHRDLKPSNIIVRDTGQIALLDFGVAKMLDEETLSGDATQLTREIGQAITPAYASPEQLLGQSISTASDIYSAGILLYELLCGQRPFAGAEHNLVALMNAQHAVPTFAVTLQSNPEFDAAQFGVSSSDALVTALRGDLTAITTYALRREPGKRYASAAAFADDLRRHLQYEPVLAREGAALYYLQKFVRSHRAPLVIGATGTLVALVLGATALRQHQTKATQIAQADAVTKLMLNVFQGISPEFANKREFTARELLNRTVAVLPKEALINQDWELFKQIADVYSSNGLYEQAIELLQQRIAHTDASGNDIEKLDALNALAWAQMLSGSNPQQIVATLNEADLVAARTPNHSAAIKLTRHYLKCTQAIRSNDLELAKVEAAQMDVALRLGKGEIKGEWMVRYLVTRARLAEKLNDLRGAESYYQSGLKFSESMGDSGQAHSLRLTVYLGQLWQKSRNYAPILAQLPATIALFEKRYGETDTMSLQAKYLLASSQLDSGEISAARLGAQKILQLARESKQLRMQANLVLLEAGLQSSVQEVFERDFAEWSTSKEFDDTTLISPENLALQTVRLRAIHFLIQQRNREAFELLSQWEKGTRQVEGAIRSLQMRYVLAIAMLRQERLVEAERELRAIQAEREKRFGMGEIGCVLIEAYLSLLPQSFQKLNAEKRAVLAKTWNENSQINLLLSMLDSKPANIQWKSLPFVFFSERS